MTGVMEAGEQLHTQYLISFIIKDLIFDQKNVGFLYQSAQQMIEDFHQLWHDNHIYSSNVKSKPKLCTYTTILNENVCKYICRMSIHRESLGL